MNKEISYKLAKLLKEKGFAEKTTYAFKTDGTIINFGKDGANVNLNYNSFRQESKRSLTSAPTISQVIMWLYETHGIWIYVRNFETLPFCSYILKSGDSMIAFNNDNKGFNSPTEAYETAIEYTLNNLI